MSRLPVPGSDNGNWGDILNDYLVQSHKNDGTLKDNSVTSNTIAPGAVTKATVGLPNADNTADLSKPVSSAQQTALNLKLSAASNLSDLAVPATARTNLGLGSAAIMTPATIADELALFPRITDVSPALASGVSDTSHPTIIGVASPFSLISLYLNGAVVGTTFADAAGSWAIALPAQLNGQVNLIARAAPASSITTFVINDPKQPIQNAEGVAAVFEMDNERGLFFTNGVPYGDLASLVGAVSGSISGTAIAMGGYIDPAATNIVTNGTFDTVTTGWNPIASASLAIVSGEMQYTLVGAGDGFSQTVAGYSGRAFAFTGTGRRGTNVSNSPFIAATTTSAAMGGNTTLGPSVTASNVTSTVYLSSLAGSGMYVGVKGSSGGGTSLFDNFSLYEALPLPGWATVATTSGASPTSFSVLIDAVAPSSLPTSGQVKVIWQADTNTQRDRIRLHWAADGTVHFIVTGNNGQVLDYTLGTVAVNTRFRVTLAASAGVNGDASTGYAASLNGANNQSLYNSSTSMIGVSHMRIGQDIGGTSVWNGTFNRVAVVRSRQLGDWLEYYAALPTATPRLFAGDSYIGGASGVILPDLYETATGQVTINIGVGGSTFLQQLGFITSRPYLRNLPMVIWDGSNNGMVDIASQIAIAQQIWDWKSDGRILFLPSIAVPNPGQASSSATNSNGVYLRQYRDALIAAFGAAHVYDPVPVLQTLSSNSADDINDIAAGLIPRSILLTQNNNEVHLGTAAMTAIAQHSVFQSKIAAL